MLNQHGEKVRYLAVGGWNTVFGYGVFALLFMVLPLHYMAVAVVANILAITNAYLGYKFLVFRTRGNCLREYLRFYVVYGSSALFALALLPALVNLFHISPLLAQAFVVPATVAFSYLGHKHYSFRTGY
jgi:putative flippase GtrA